MREVVTYEADDGSRHADREAALARDAVLAAMAAALGPLGSRPGSIPFSNGEGYVQHRAEDVLAAKATLVSLVVAENPDLGPRLAGRSPGDVDFVGGIVGRVLDDSDSPLYRAWYRLGCIDDEDREWGQPYYLLHPQHRTTVEIRKANES